MNSIQYCPHCEAENKVFGLYWPGERALKTEGANLNVKCGSCGKEFVATNDLSPKSQGETAGA